MTRKITLIVAAAILLRIVYQVAILGFDGSFHNGSDSQKYIVIAENLLATGSFSYIEAGDGEPTLTPVTDRMPLYPYFVAGMMAVFDEGTLTAIAVSQAFLDGLTIALLALAAAAIDRRLAIPTAVFAAIAPNLLVHASYILTETVFLFFFVAALTALLWALRGWRTTTMLVCAGLALGLALLTRPVMMFFPLFLFPTLLYAFPSARKVPLGRTAMLAGIPVLIMIAFALPRLADNHVRFGHAVLTTQSGAHLLKWVYPCLNTPWSCASHGDDWEVSKPLVDDRLAELSPADVANPATRNEVYQSVAVERISELGVFQIAVGSVVGAFKNVIQTGFYETLTQFRQPATFFSAMTGNNATEKIGNFLKTNSTNTFMMLWAVAQGSLMLARVVQLVGLGAGLSKPHLRPFTILLTMTIIYFLAVNGPIGNPKYRIPAEPGFFILMSMGLYTIFDWYRARRKPVTENRNPEPS